ncbi:MAG: stage II sporulation protein R [Clostridia bacterium]|nr:stage II sporulation protein R [Clostridia bacterium]
MKRIEISILLSLVFGAILSMSAANLESKAIRGSVLRLHVLANSDSESDQALKLKVRDRLLTVSRTLYADADSRDEAIARTREELPRLQAEAERVLRENGSQDGVRVVLEDTYFTTRTYGDVTLPAGEYTAVRVMIGQAKGHNWWCVMFPPLCLSAAEEEPDAAESLCLEDVLSGEEMDFVEGGGYEPRFKCVELYEAFKKRCGTGNLS